MRVHKLNNVEKAMDLLEKQKVFEWRSTPQYNCYSYGEQLIQVQTYITFIRRRQAVQAYESRA